MSETTETSMPATEHVPSEGTQLTPESGFTVTAFGSVQEFDLSKLIDDAGEIVTNKSVAVPDSVAVAMWREVAFFAGAPNNAKRSLPLPTPEAADTLRAQIAEFARRNNLYVTFPVHRPAHTVAAHKSKDGKDIPAKFVKDNKVPAHFNKGTNVTYRITRKSEPTPAAGPVTVTQGTPTPATIPPRGAQIIGNQTARKGK